MKLNESGFRTPLCTYRLNWARRTSWGWWVDWDDTVLQTQYSKFEPWRSEAEHATSRPRRLPTILTFTRGWGRIFFCFFKPPRPGTEPRTLAWKAAVLTTTLGPPPLEEIKAKLFKLQLTVGPASTLKPAVLNLLTTKLFNLNFHPLEVVSGWRDPQLQVSGNYSDLTKWTTTLFKFCRLMSHFIFTIFKMWYLMC